MIEFAKLPIEERIPYFQEVASRRNLTLRIVEKDFWVCFILKTIFSLPDFKDSFVFKGGTSLSKAFGIISRFSEDIDLTLNPEWLGINEDSLPDFELSISKRKMRCAELRTECANKVQSRIQTILEEALTTQIGTSKSKDGHFEYDANTQALIFKYPTTEDIESGFITPQIKLEIGAHPGYLPNGIYSITSWVAEEFQGLMKGPEAQVICLDARRTFWEKATILHAEYHRPPGSRIRSNLSRDIYDLCKMYSHESGQRALTDLQLLEKVVHHKQLYFYVEWANYASATPGSFKLMPSGPRRSVIESEYKKMQEMFFETPPTYDELLDQLQIIEDAINLAEHT